MAATAFYLLSREQFGFDVGEGFEFQCVAAGVFEKHRVLFAGLTFKSYVRFDSELIDKGSHAFR